MLVQFAKPLVKARFEYQVPAPTHIDVNDLNDFATGRQWTGMLVTIQNVSITGPLTNDGKGRITAKFPPNTTTDAVSMSNELFDVAGWNGANGDPIDTGKTIKSLTGMVTWFFSYHIAPRTPDDIVVQ